MVFFKQIEVRCMRDKYGGTQRGLFALEKISKGEKVWCCECTDKDMTFTRQQLLNLISKHPKLDYFIRSFSYMIDDDLYALPRTYMEEKNNDECALFNHSCNPNCGFIDEGFGDHIVCIRDIEVGEELAVHYGLLETEASLINGLKCECKSANCCGHLTFDFYRDENFVQKYFPYMTPYLREKALDMKRKWFAKTCYVKRVAASMTPASSSASIQSNSSSDSSSNDEEASFEEASPAEEIDLQIENMQKGLFSLQPLKKGDLVATFCDSSRILPDNHYLRHSVEPNCVLIGQNVFVNVDVPHETELTIYYHGILL
jgi:SET domain-containing protein